jgi:hypothetical protein
MMTLILIAQLAAADVPCTVPVPADSGEWKQISASSVTFCVPAAWRVRGTRASYSGGSIRWQNSAPPVMTRQSTGPTSISGGGGTSANSTPLRTERFPETIGGRQADVWRQTGVGRLQTGVSFAQAPLFSIIGEAAGDEQVAVQLAVFRTVRFVSPGP